MEPTPSHGMLLPRCSAILLFVSLACLAGAAETGRRPDFPDVPAGQTRSDKALRGGKMPYWDDRPDMAQPMVATFIGGKGSEWLCAGGFQPDGTIVLAGNVNGGEFALAVKETVLGRDGSNPGPAVFKPVAGKDAEKPTWTRPDTTGFIVFATPDLKTITKVVRLPWASAAITTMVVGEDGSIYLAGKPGPDIALLGGRQRALAVSPDAERKDFHADAAFIAKLTRDCSKVEWLYTAAGKTDAPQVGLGAKGRITFGAQDLRVFDAAGEQLGVTVVPGGVRETTAVSPVDGTIVRGGERNTGTGREPWRCPILKTHEPDGTLRYQLYEWPSRYVVLDNCRAVSDTAVRGVSFDRDGNLLVKLWSDGDNSIATAQPTDLRSGPPNSGLGLNSAGANATSFTYCLYPHAGTWREARTHQEALNLNDPLSVHVRAAAKKSRDGSHRFLKLDGEGLALEAVKRSEDGTSLIVRVVQRTNARTNGRLQLDVPILKAWSCNLMEEKETPLKVSDGGIDFAAKPCEIITLRLDCDRG